MAKSKAVDELRKLVGSEDTAAITIALREFAQDQQARLEADSERRMVKVNKFLAQAADELFKVPSLERREPVKALLQTSERREAGHGPDDQALEHTGTVHDIETRLLAICMDSVKEPAEALAKLLERIDSGDLPVL